MNQNNFNLNDITLMDVSIITLVDILI